MDTYTGPDGTAFDFSNDPGHVCYLSGRDPATRFYHLSMAIPADTQRILIDELRVTTPFPTEAEGMGLELDRPISRTFTLSGASEAPLNSVKFRLRARLGCGPGGSRRRWYALTDPMYLTSHGEQTLRSAAIVLTVPAPD